MSDGLSDLEQAALAWREADVHWIDAGQRRGGPEFWQRCAAEAKLRVVIDQMPAARAAQGRAE